jgi:hypothetical protein
MIETQRAGFEELYKAFFDFFLESIGKDSSPWNKVKLQMMSQYFDDLPLYKAINPIIARINSNPEDRRAIARAALWDAIFAHHNGLMVKAFEMGTPKPAETFTFASAPEATFVLRKRGRPAKIS